MSTIIKIVASGMQSQQARMEAISHNLANVNTPGFKTSRIEFQDKQYVQQKVTASVGGGSVTADAWVGTGVTASNRTMLSQGSLIFTGLPTDVAIVGDGFFPVRLPDGQTGYTRNGAFQTDSQGRLVTADGYPLDPGVQTQPGTTLRTTDSGEVQLVNSKGDTMGEAGVIRTVTFINPEGLQPVGKGLYLATAESGQPNVGTPGRDGHGKLAAGAMEQSNVSVADEMVNMLEAQRAYQVAAKAVSALMEMLQEASSIER